MISHAVGDTDCRSSAAMYKMHYSSAIAMAKIRSYSVPSVYLC